MLCPAITLGASHEHRRLARTRDFSRVVRLGHLADGIAGAVPHDLDGGGTAHRGGGHAIGVGAVATWPDCNRLTKKPRTCFHVESGVKTT